MPFESNGTAAEAYHDRNLAILALARMALSNGHRAGVRRTGDPDWPAVYIDLPTGQVSYHVPRSCVPDDFPVYPVYWDGHDLPKKRDRVRRYVERGPLLEALERERNDAMTHERPSPQQL